MLIRLSSATLGRADGLAVAALYLSASVLAGLLAASLGYAVFS